MSKFKIVTDASCDLPPELLDKYDISDVRFYVTFDGSNYLKESVDITHAEYFRRLDTEPNFPKTSQPSPQDYIDVFTPALQKGEDVICFCISSKLSGSYQSAVNAAEILKEEYPDRKVRVIDTEHAFISMSLMILRAVKFRDEGADVDTAADYLEKIKKDTEIFIALETLENLRRGGRIGGAAAFVGGILNLKPVVRLEDGELRPITKVRGRNKSISTLIEEMKKRINGKTDEYEYMVGHARCEEDGKMLKTSLEEALGIKIDTPLLDTGVTIGTHIGLGAVAIAYSRK